MQHVYRDMLYNIGRHKKVGTWVTWGAPYKYKYVYICKEVKGLGSRDFPPKMKNQTRKNMET